MFKKTGIALLVLSSSLSLTALAGPIPYPSIGLEAPVNSFFAAATGTGKSFSFGSGGQGGTGGGGSSGGSGSSNPAPGSLLPGGPFDGLDDLPGMGDIDYPDDHPETGDGDNDDVRAISVPEPENMALLGLALMVLGISRRKRAA